MGDAVQLGLRYGTAAENASFVGAPRELVVDTDNNRLIVHDGSTAGGYPVARLDEVGLGSKNISDEDFTGALPNLIYYYIALTAARTFTLPAANTISIGKIVIVIDGTGNCSATNSITVAAAGSDRIAGNTSVKMTSPWQELRLRSNGTNLWTLA